MHISKDSILPLILTALVVMTVALFFTDKPATAVNLPQKNITSQTGRINVLEVVSSGKTLSPKEKTSIFNTLSEEQSQNYGYSEADKVRIINYLNTH